MNALDTWLWRSIGSGRMIRCLGRLMSVMVSTGYLVPACPNATAQVKLGHVYYDISIVGDTTKDPDIKMGDSITVRCTSPSGTTSTTSGKFDTVCAGAPCYRYVEQINVQGRWTLEAIITVGSGTVKKFVWYLDAAP